MACGNRHFQTILKNQLPSLSPRHGLLQVILQSHFDWRIIVSLLTRLCSLANVSRFAPEFWWQLGGGRVLRLRSISVQSRALLPATCITIFLLTCVNILVPNLWFGYRCHSSCSSSLLFCLYCTSSMLSWYQDYADSSAVFLFFYGIVWLSHMLWDVWLQVLDAVLPWLRKLLHSGKWNDCHSIFCHWLSFITVFAAPSCSPRWHQQSTGPKPWFLWTLCVHLFSKDNSSRV